MMNKYLVLDIENDNTNRYKRTAGNFLYDKIVAQGAKWHNQPIAHGYYVYAGCIRDLGAPGACNLIIGHHIKHDLLFLWAHKFMQDYLKRGGKIWDTQLAEYYLTSFQNK